MGLRRMFGIVLLSTWAMGANAKPPRYDGDTERLVTNMVLAACAEQEKTLGITHFGVPGIRFVYPGDADYRYLKKTGASAMYDVNHDALVVPSFTFRQKSKLEMVLRHELGHYYHDQLSESLGAGDWPQFVATEQGEYRTPENAGKRLISEGMATYFAKTPRGIAPDFPTERWPDVVNRFWKGNQRARFYDGGYWLVQPIIAQHGMRGIAYLMGNTPTAADLIDLAGYRQRIMEALAKQR